MKECSRLSQDGEIKSIERKKIKTSTLEKDTEEQSDAEEQHEEYNAPLMRNSCATLRCATLLVDSDTVESATAYRRRRRPCLV